MKKALMAVFVTSALGMAGCQPQTGEPAVKAEAEAPALETEAQKQAYALGAGMGTYAQNNLEMRKEFGLEFDQALLVQGFNDALKGESMLDMQELQTLTRDAETQLREKQQEASNKAAEQNKQAGAEYLAKNAGREEITVTESGLQYEVLSAGEGAKPAATDTVKVHYKGTLLDGTEFDSSYARGEPTVFPLNRVISGWTEGLQLMNTGAKYRFHIPSELAYGERATGKITPNSTLIFDVELLEVVTPEG